MNQQPTPEFDALEQLAQFQPDDAAASRALDRAREALSQSAKRNILFQRRWLVRISAAAAIVVVGMLGWLLTSPGRSLAAPTWLDVIKQSADVQLAKIDLRAYRDQTPAERLVAYVQAPSTMRSQEYEYINGQETATQGSIVTPEGGIRWDSRSKVAEHIDADNAYVPPADMARQLLAVLGMAVRHDDRDMKITINGTQVRFEPVQDRHPFAPELRGFALRSADSATDTNQIQSRLVKLTFWFDARANVLRRLTGPAGSGQDKDFWQDAIIEFEPDVPADFFDIKPPADFADVDAGIRARLPQDVREVYDAVEAAKQRFGDYRALIWLYKQGHGWPICRESKRGRQWRIDTLDWTSSAFVEAKQGRSAEPDDAVDVLWPMLTEPGFKPEMTAMRYGDRYALIHYNVSGRGPRVTANLYVQPTVHGYDNYFGHTFRALAWPEWVEWEGEHPHGRDVREPLLKWRLLPGDPQHPDWVDVVGEREASSYRYVRYTFDRAHDYLCVRQEVRDYERSFLIWDVLEFAQTSNGRWYPKRIAKHYKPGPPDHWETTGKQWSYAFDVENGAADESFFAWPSEAPQPTDPFAGLKPQRFSVAERKDQTRDWPDTAKGKWTFMATRGLPRGFDDVATSKAHWDMTRVMGAIHAAIGEYRDDHNWKQPPTLASLNDDRYITWEQMKNPLHPDADPPFGYICIPKGLPNFSGRMMLYEPFEDWPGVVTVMFTDGTFETVHDKAAFEQLVHEATSPDEPTRYQE